MEHYKASVLEHKTETYATLPLNYQRYGGTGTDVKETLVRYRCNMESPRCRHGIAYIISLHKKFARINWNVTRPRFWSIRPRPTLRYGLGTHVIEFLPIGVNLAVVIFCTFWYPHTAPWSFTIFDSWCSVTTISVHITSTTSKVSGTTSGTIGSFHMLQMNIVSQPSHPLAVTP